MNRYNLDVEQPNDVPVVLETVANYYRESASELSTARQDPNAGEVWEDFSRILNRAADSCRRALNRRSI